MGGCMSRIVHPDKYWIARVQESGLSLQFAPPKLRGDKRVVLAAVQENGLALQYTTSELKNDEQIVRAAIRKHGMALQYASPRLQNDYNIVKAGVQSTAGWALQYASLDLRNDKRIVLEALPKNGFALEYTKVTWEKDSIVTYEMLEAAKMRGSPLQFASARLQTDDDIISEAKKLDSVLWMEKVSWNANALMQAPEHIRADQRIVAKAVTQRGELLQYASPEMQKDKEIVLMAAHQNILSFQYASSECRNDMNIVLELIPLSARTVLSLASPALQNNQRVVIMAVRHDGRALEFASPQLQNTKAVVLMAVQQDGTALEFASPTLKDDKVIVMAAIQQNGEALQYASIEMKQDKEVVLTAMKDNPDNIKFAHEDRKRDPDALIAAGMFDQDHQQHRDDDNNNCHSQPRTKNMSSGDTCVVQKKKIALSTRFSLHQSSHSEATIFTKLFNDHEYIQKGGFKVYAPNAFDKKTCDPNWTNLEWPCRGTKETCRFPLEKKTGHPTDNSCWRYSFRYQLQDAKQSGGFMLQLVERQDYDSLDLPTLGNGQAIEREMAQSLGMKIFHVYRPMELASGRKLSFERHHMQEVVESIRGWYDNNCQDLSECRVLPLEGNKL